MTGTTEKAFWKQPIVYFLFLLVGATGALMGDRWLEAKLAAVPDSTESQVTPPALPDAGSGSDTSATPKLNPPSWFPQKADRFPGETSNFIVEAADRVGPAVVRINASRRVRPDRFDRFEEPFPNEFFGDGFGPPGGRPPGDRLEEGTGSGFILSPDGHILTNSHVVEGTDEVQVVLKDGRRYDGTVLGTDDVTDVAVIKINATDLPTVPLGDSDLLSPGEWAIAIGNPLGLDNSVTVGIISATGRSSSDVGVPDKRIGFIQTDAAINPGNSGGPLLNAKGEVIGMNTAIINGAQGLGFAIPINNAQQIAQQLIATGRAEHAYLGIEMILLNPELRRELQNSSGLAFPVPDTNGVLIVNVIDASPADRGGLQPGDVILAIDGQTIATSEMVQRIVQNKTVGSTLQIEVNRNGRSQLLEVQTGNMPPQMSS
ncbi:HhoA/HhoB/HtrA family serine endopeptidase [Lyngbya sp. CCY1209]|uniref:HhoA/HhoB/HtrA family serine endopeptidase n=1 Tax=Lyngbya sp. CCY1209 TaxID=2886103 RepID=UPI002D1FF9B2|nr:HhoA/HhoB/HtrA family serine endopeptidase [Lyngbya sp. CCY1209]MEB3883878.1 trypsin-like peptidase domain-containing protein [Lyngbya sp. CCY1209]